MSNCIKDVRHRVVKCLYQCGINIPDADSMLRASVFNGLVIIAAIQDIRNTVIASAVNFTLDPALFAGKTLVNLEFYLTFVWDI